jgi:hypothetical protein
VDEPTGSYAKHVALLAQAMWKAEPTLEVRAFLTRPADRFDCELATLWLAA